VALRYSMGLSMFVVLACLGVCGPAAQAYTTGPSPWALCVSSSVGVVQGLEASLGPADGANTQQDAAVAFSGSSIVPVSFAVASSPTLLSTPDIDSGPGVQQAPSSDEATYTFTSGKAAATAGTVYWAASLSNAGLPDCSGLEPTTYMTKARSLTVLAPARITIGMKAPPPVLSVASLVGTSLRVGPDGVTTVEVACEGDGFCGGNLTLRVRRPVRKHGSKTFHSTIIGSKGFSIAAGIRTTVSMHLNVTGRRLLTEAHRYLVASLQLEQVHGMQQTLTRAVRLVKAAPLGKKR
jgi:hypothetical protein